VSYLTIPIELDAEALVEQVFADMAEAFPGWEPSPGNPESFLIRAVVYRLVVPLVQLAADVPDEIAHRLGEEVFNLAPIAPTAATIATTWTFVDDAGYTIKAGTEVDIATAADEAKGFRVLNEVTVPPASTATDAGAVILEAVEDGTDYNGLDGDATPVDSILGFESIALVGSTSGGTDAEEPATYLTRLVDTLKTMGPHPIIASDVETLARNISGVTGALALDLYDPGTDDPEDTGTWDTERTVTVAVHDPDGEPCSSGVKADVEADLEAKREANFVFNVVDFDYTEVDVAYTVAVLPGHDQATVEAGIDAALEEYLSPANWGFPIPGDATQRQRRKTLYFQDIVTLINNQQGVDVYTYLAINATGDTPATDDVTLDGAAPLPRPGIIGVATS
jgi:hypothetical protein